MGHVPLTKRPFQRMLISSGINQRVHTSVQCGIHRGCFSGVLRCPTFIAFDEDGFNITQVDKDVLAIL